MPDDDKGRSKDANPAITPGAEKAFLGAEFVTWLFFHLEAEGWMLELTEMGERGASSTVGFAMGERATLRPIDGGGARVSLAGPDLDDSGELLEAVRRGAFLDSLELQAALGERVLTFTLRALDGGISSVKLPDLLSSGSDDDEDTARFDDEPKPKKRRQKIDPADVLGLRMACLEDIERVVDALFARFITRRVARAWASEEVLAMRRRIGEGLRARAPAEER